MFGFSRKTDLALLLLTALAEYRRGYLSMRALARERRLPYRFASEVAGVLTRAGFLEAREGAGGGYRLAKSPEKILISAVLSATENATAVVSCLDPRAHARCPQQAWCTARAGMGMLQRRLMQTIETLNLTDFVREHARAKTESTQSHG